MIESLGLRDEIMYVGYIENRTVIYSISDIAVVPSIWQEPLALVAIEGLASCRPVIAYYVSGFPEILRDLPYDFLVKSVSSRALSDKIIEARRR